MKVFLFGEFSKKVINRVFLDPKCEEVFLEGFCIAYNYEGKAFADPKEGSKIKGFLIELSDDQIWKLDQWKGIFNIQRKRIEDGALCVYNAENDCEKIKDSNCYTYISENDCLKNKDYVAVDGQLVIDAFNKINNSLVFADVHLLIPGHVKDREKIVAIEEPTSEHLNEMIKKANNDEFADDFIKDNERYVLSKCLLKYADKDNVGKEIIITQQASIVAMIHNETKLCVVDIYIPYISISTHALLSKYCSNELFVEIDNKTLLIEEYLKELSITIYGSKRSLVFCYDDMNESEKDTKDRTQLLNLLVNEEKPMGAIKGKHFIDIIDNDMAQYDTARVYASETTLVEITKERPNEVFDRIASQALEIFFIEMLLLQDAAVSRLNTRVKKEVIIERKNPLRKNQKEIINDLLHEMSYAINFADYKQFYFPTVRVSAEKVTKAFGIDYITNKYEQNKILLERMIASHQRIVEEKENLLKNSLLGIITLLSAAKTVNEAINLATHRKIESFSFWISLAITIAGGVLYFILNKTYLKCSVKRREKKRKKEDKE
ncbi:MAG TPA: hypothetical protein PKX91_03555 [Clostridia bacterium]|jgi:hypothetical protein|nr:hypothetical protein [Clostridia bacterium]